MKEPQHIVHEAYGDYKDRMTSGNFLYVIFGGALLSSFGLIMFGISKGIGDRFVFGLLILLGIWVMYKGAIPRKKKRHKDTARRISYG